MIINAKDKKLTCVQGELPNMSGTIIDYFQKIRFIIVTKTVVNFEIVETYEQKQFNGVIQPFTTQELIMKPEGQRSWSWVMIHALPDLVLRPDDVLYVENFRYRVMGILDYSKYGYLEYHAIQDYQDIPFAPPVSERESLKKWNGNIVVDGTLTYLLDISGDEDGPDDAFLAIWRVSDLDGKQVATATIQVLTQTQIQITVLAPGEYQVMGAQ